MIPAHHPPDSHWLDYARGEADPTLRIMLEAHLDLCDACAAQVAALSEAGGALLRRIRPQAPPEDLFDRILERLPQGPSPAHFHLPPSFRPLLPDEGGRAWRGLLKAGVRFLEVAAEEGRGLRLYLVHLAAGATFPHHSHRGSEQALILAGGARDGSLVLEAGDWKQYGPHSAHQPGALPDEDCWLLVRVEDEIRFSGWRRLFQ